MVFFFAGRAKPDLCEPEVKNTNVIDALTTVSIIRYLTLPEICGTSNCCYSNLTTFLFYVRMQKLMQSLSFTTSELSQKMIWLTCRLFFLSSIFWVFSCPTNHVPSVLMSVFFKQKDQVLRGSGKSQITKQQKSQACHTIELCREIRWAFVDPFHQMLQGKNNGQKSLRGWRRKQKRCFLSASLYH